MIGGFMRFEGCKARRATRRIAILWAAGLSVAALAWGWQSEGQQPTAAATQTANGTKLVSRAATAVAASDRVEVETVEIRRLMAIPNKIQRHPGKFILLVTNENRADFDAAFVLDPSSVGDGIVGPNPLLRFGGKGLTDAKNRSVTIVDAVAGSWDLKSATTGKIACRITIQ